MSGIKNDIIPRFWSKVSVRGHYQCWLWNASSTMTACGIRYGAFRHNGKTRRSNRVAWEITHGPIPKGLIVRHSCDVSLCCNPRHLLLGTYADNIKDMYERNRRNPPKGKSHPHAKLTEKDIPKIRELIAAGELQKDIAKIFRIDSSIISDIANNRIWKHVR